MANLRHQVLAVDSQVAQLQRRARWQARPRSLAELLQVARIRWLAAADVVGGAQRSTRSSTIRAPDAANEAPYGRVAPTRLVVEHVVGDQLRDVVGVAARKGQPARADRPPSGLPQGRGRRSGRRRTSSACRCRAAARRGAAAGWRDRCAPRHRALRGSGPTGRDLGPCPAALRAARRAAAGSAARTPVSARMTNATDGGLAADHPPQLAADTFGGYPARRFRPSACIAASVAGSMSKPSCAASRAARSSRRPSSSKRMARLADCPQRLSRRSARPPVGSTHVVGAPAARPQAIALTVKSRRCRSAAMSGR